MKIRRVRNLFIKRSMKVILEALAYLAKDPRKQHISDKVLKSMATGMVTLKRIKPAHDLRSLGEGWQKGFAATKEIPITLITNDTVYAEIHTHCPHKGTGNLEACHRMMAYDRHLLAALGGEFEVLSSQADPNVSVCKVAMRLKKQSSAN